MSDLASKLAPSERSGGDKARRQAKSFEVRDGKEKARGYRVVRPGNPPALIAIASIEGETLWRLSSGTGKDAWYERVDLEP